MDEDESVFSPKDVLNYIARTQNMDVKAFRIPPRIVMVYNFRHFDIASKLIGGKPIKWWWYKDRLRMHFGLFNNVEIASVMNFVGSPAAAMVFEELIACGAKKIFEVGISGGVQPFLMPGDIVVASEAICDEGTTSQYYRHQQKAVSDASLKMGLISELNKNHVCHHVGSVLTTDGVYRETLSKFKRFLKMGILAINMETSALYSVAKYRGVEIASAFVISDLLTESKWRPAFAEKKVLSNIEVLLRGVVLALSKA